MKTFGYLNTHVKIISHLNALSSIAKFHKPDIETTLVTRYLLSQYGMKKLIKLFCEHILRAVWKELEQIHDRKVVQQRLPIELAYEQKRRSLSHLMFIKEKIDGSIKVQGCADGRYQRLWMKKEDTISPTVSI